MLGLVAVLLRQWRVVAATVLAVAVITLVVGFLRPKSYSARTVLFIADNGSQGGGTGMMMAAQLGLAVPGLSLGGNPNQQLIETILHKGRSVRDLVADRAADAAGGGQEGEALVYRILDKGTSLESAPDGSIVIDVAAPDPELAAVIATEYPRAINATAARVAEQASVEKRRFLEEQLAEARKRLERSEERMVAFQRRENAPSIQRQAEETVQAAASLQQEVMRREVEVAQLRRISGPDNPALQAAVAGLADLRAQLRRLTSASGQGGDLFVPLGGSAELQRDATRLTRELTRDQQVYVSLLGAFSEAEIDSNSNLPVVTVIDAPLVPKSPSGAGVVFRLVFATALGVAIGVVLAFAREYMSNARRRPENDAFFSAWDRIRAALRWTRRRTPAGVPSRSEQPG